MTLSFNENIKQYIEYYDKLMENLAKKRTIRFDRAGALKIMNKETILKMKKNVKIEEENEENLEEEKIDFHRNEVKKEIKNESKLWKIINKQKNKGIAGRNSEKSESEISLHTDTNKKVEYSIINQNAIIQQGK